MFQMQVIFVVLKFSDHKSLKQNTFKTITIKIKYFYVFFLILLLKKIVYWKILTFSLTLYYHCKIKFKNLHKYINYKMYWTLYKVLTLNINNNFSNI